MKVNTSISFVIPTRNEEKSVRELFLGIKRETEKLKVPFEVIFVDDGSTDGTFEILEKLHREDARVKVIKLRGNFGKSIALSSGFEKAKGEIIFTMDADLQDDPTDIPKFIDELEKGYDMVSGWKKVRHDPLSKTFPSKIGNLLTRTFTGIKIHDLNCGFKAYKKAVIQNLHLYGELYKYIPVLARNQNFNVGEIIVKHHPRKYGKSKFGWSRNIKGFLDMLTIIFLSGYLRRPSHFFGTFGIISFFIGFCIGVYISYLRFTTGSIQYRQPLLFLGILLMIIGIQLVTTGLLAEMLVNFNQEKKSYKRLIVESLE